MQQTQCLNHGRSCATGPGGNNAGRHLPWATPMASMLRSSQLQSEACHPAAATASTWRQSRARLQTVRVSAGAAAAASVIQAEDKWVERMLSTAGGGADEDGLPSQLQSVRNACLEAASSLRMPTTRNEDYRFTDLSPLLKRNAVAPAPLDPATLEAARLAADACELSSRRAFRVVLVDGVLVPELSKGMEGLPEWAYVGPPGGAPSQAVEKLGSQAASRGGPFALLNGAALGAGGGGLAVVVSDNTELEDPVHVVYCCTGAADAADVVASSPRLYVACGKHSVVKVVEEFVSVGPHADQGGAFTNSVAEVHVAEEGQVTLNYVQQQSAGSFHLRSTLVSQSERSRFALTEVQLGGQLARHDISVQQDGPETHTGMKSFLMPGDGQLQDLHSKLRLSHPGGEAEQLHKCIVTGASGRGVFDGNVRVEKAAQKTDAQQLSRNLLLVPKATVNVKPNLQIIADDVKCTHGCAVSDLEDEQLFYFAARGIGQQAARQALVYSFGSEVVCCLEDKDLVKRVQAAVNAKLEGIKA